MGHRAGVGSQGRVRGQRWLGLREVIGLVMRDGEYVSSVVLRGRPLDRDGVYIGGVTGTISKA